MAVRLDETVRLSRMRCAPAGKVAQHGCRMVALLMSVRRVLACEGFFRKRLSHVPMRLGRDRSCADARVSRPRMGRAAARRPQVVRVPVSGGCTGRLEL